ncbi:hypothetical protein H0H81_003715, partial [Sphagnurus paluster]
FAGLAPGPFAGLILADNGASVTRVDKPGTVSIDVLCRGKRSIAVSPKTESGLAILKRLICNADVLIDPFRPGVMERLGLGPEVFLGDGNKPGLNPKLIYARIVGCVQDLRECCFSANPYVMLPGSDKPAFPLNLLADFAGGGLICALGILLALIERGKSGRGQVVNADMVSGAQYIAVYPLLHSLIPASPLFANPRGENLLDGGAPFYDIYTCSDGRHMSVGCLEPQFFHVFITTFLRALPHGFIPSGGWIPTAKMQSDRQQWSQLRDFLTRGFTTNTRDYWAQVFHETDACALPVLTPEEARASLPHGAPFPPTHPQIVGSSHPSVIRSSAAKTVLKTGKHTEEILKELGVSEAEKQKLISDGALEKAGSPSKTHAKL